MDMKMPEIPTYDGIKKADRSGRDTLCWQFYYKDCGFVFGSCNDLGARDYTMKGLEKVECEGCGSKNWDNREVSD